jgi:hypothetical protein
MHCVRPVGEYSKPYYISNYMKRHYQTRWKGKKISKNNKLVYIYIRIYRGYWYELQINISKNTERVIQKL